MEKKVYTYPTLEVMRVNTADMICDNPGSAPAGQTPSILPPTPTNPANPAPGKRVF